MLARFILYIADAVDDHRLWTVVAAVVFTWKIIDMAAPSEEMMLVYMGTVGGLSTVNKIIAMKYGVKSPPNDP